MEQPIGTGQTFTVTNNVGRTAIHGGTGSVIHVVADRHFTSTGHEPEVRLRPAGNGVQLDATTHDFFPFGSSWVDYTIDVPAGVNVNVRGTSGSLDISGVNANVQANTNSGSIDLNNIGGEVRATTSSGQVHGTQLVHVRDVSTSSGSVLLEGVFTDQASIKASSG